MIHLPAHASRLSREVRAYSNGEGARFGDRKGCPLSPFLHDIALTPHFQTHIFFSPFKLSHYLPCFLKRQPNDHNTRVFGHHYGHILFRRLALLSEGPRDCFLPLFGLSFDFLFIDYEWGLRLPPCLSLSLSLFPYFAHLFGSSCIPSFPLPFFNEVTD